ncbi:MAG: hypothetical protein ABI120_25245, partial [Gemmatimonadaceae bacterium]
MRRFRQTFTVLSTVLLAAFPADAQPALTAIRDHIDPTQLRARSDSFAVIIQGAPRGWQRISITPRGNSWELQDAITIGSMVQQSSHITLNTALEEISLRQSGVMSGRAMTISLDFASGQVRGTADTPSNGPAGVLKIDTTLSAAVVDDNAVTPLLLALRWYESLDIRFPVLASGKGTVMTYRIRVLGADSSTVPAGTFDTWRAELTADRSTLLLQVTRALPHRIVRMTSIGTPFDIQLVK